MENSTQYYCVGFTWNDTVPSSQLVRFLEEGIWENGFEDKYIQRVKSVPTGSRIAAKTTFTRKENKETISILQIYATGTVIENPQDGQLLRVKWDKTFEPFEIKNRGAYRSTISRVNNVNTIKAIFREDGILLADDIRFYSLNEFKQERHYYPCFVFNQNKWDDYGYQTQYDITYWESDKESTLIGTTKFYNKDSDSGNLPEMFSVLDENYCSLGQSNSYYLNIREKLPKELADKYFDITNDLAINRGLLEYFEHETGFKTSLLRSSEAQKALREGARIYLGIRIDNVLTFAFSTKLEKAEGAHKVKFDFSEKASLPFRIKVIIGKNGTGKTQYIGRLAATLSGYEKQGDFSTKFLPPFSRIIAISYSLFDRFPRPKQTKTFSYYYCGFQSGRGFLTENQIQQRASRAFATLKKNERTNLFGKYLTLILSEGITADILDDDYEEFSINDFSFYDENGYSRYSSGQIVMILMLAEILAYITRESLLLFDEPETHLHPNSISLFINVINRILRRFDSYAVISTHSPQVVQEVPSKDLIVFERIGNMPSVRGLDIEAFGENLNTITERIFHTISHDEYYREFLKNISKQESYESIVEMFKNNSLPLSFNSKIYLQSLYEKSNSTSSED